MPRLPLPSPCALLCCAIVLTAASLTPAARAADLGVGDAAPALAQGKYVQGEPVKSFEKGKVYVVEMWATWCGPCIAAIPHVNELQQKYADKGLVVIGQNVWERDPSKVEPFVKDMGAKMAYRVAMDDVSAGDDAGKMAETWMKAAGRNGIPCSFIVDKDGKVAWIGHPMQMGEPLQQVIDGTFDIAKAKAAAAQEQAAAKAMQEVASAARAGNWAEVLTKLDAAGEVSPAVAPQLTAIRYKALTETKQADKAAALAKDALANADKQPISALMIGDMAFQAQDYDLSAKLATAAAPHAKRMAFQAHALAARAYAGQDDYAKAAAALKQAVESAPEQAKPALERQLKEYEEKAAGAKKPS